MPVTFTQPTTGAPLGPGFVISGSTDFIGPIPSDYYWHLVLYSSTDETKKVWEWTFVGGVQTWQFVVGMTDVGTMSIQAPTSQTANGKNLILKAELVQPSPTTVIDSGTVAVVADWNSGVPWLQQFSHGSAGLTSDQAAQLEAAQLNTQVTLPGLAGDIIVGIGQLLQGVPAQFSSRHTSMLISGQGAISRGTEPFRLDSLGIEWHWNTIPPNAGKLLGDPDEYVDRVVQFRLIDQDDSGQLYQMDTIDSSMEGVRHMWGIHSPVTLEWFVSPGWVVELAFTVTAFG